MKSINDQNVHVDDQPAILEIYRELTKEERVDVDDVKGVHWIGKTFDHSPSVAAIASLSSLQKEILSARAEAITLIRRRVGGGEYSFNKIIPLAYGPEVVNANEDFTVEVLMAAYLEWGTDCVKRFNGMWSFCIYDKVKNILFLSFRSISHFLLSGSLFLITFFNRNVDTYSFLINSINSI